MKITRFDKVINFYENGVNIDIIKKYNMENNEEDETDSGRDRHRDIEMVTEIKVQTERDSDRDRDKPIPGTHVGKLKNLSHTGEMIPSISWKRPLVTIH